jgi:hypothetical protein
MKCTPDWRRGYRQIPISFAESNVNAVGQKIISVHILVIQDLIPLHKRIHWVLYAVHMELGESCLVHKDVG